MSPFSAVPQLELRNVRKLVTAGVGNCRVRVTVLGGVSLRLHPGEALAVTGALPMARSMLCAIAAGLARCDSGSVHWGPRGLTDVRYLPTGDAPRAVQRRPDGRVPGLVILDEALTERGPSPDVPTLVALLRPWLAEGGAALVAAPVRAHDGWPWPVLELAAGQLRPLVMPVPPSAAAWSAPARMVAEGRGERVGEWRADHVAPAGPDR